MVGVTFEKEHYALIMYDNAGQDNGQPIDEKLYIRWYTDGFIIT